MKYTGKCLKRPKKKQINDGNDNKGTAQSKMLFYFLQVIAGFSPGELTISQASVQVTMASASFMK